MKAVFHRISYLQYVLMAVSLYFFAGFALTLDGTADWGQLNTALVFYGIAISVSTLQDTTTTQNKISRKVWESPVYGKLFLGLIGLLVVAFLAAGLIGFIRLEEDTLKDVSFGLIVIGIGLTGILKSAGEMFDNHRLDRNPGRRRTGD
jgi:hypothetical protein